MTPRNCLAYLPYAASPFAITQLSQHFDPFMRASVAMTKGDSLRRLGGRLKFLLPGEQLLTQSL
jgi:hypothetical protein